MKASEWFDAATDALIEDLKLPEKRAGLVVTAMASALCVRAGMRFLPSLLFSAAAGYGAERLYVVVDDMHQAALANLDAYRAIGAGLDGAPGPD